jgi:hypothetical protein
MAKAILKILIIVAQPFVMPRFRRPGKGPLALFEYLNTMAVPAGRSSNRPADLTQTILSWFFATPIEANPHHLAISRAKEVCALNPHWR